MILKCFLIYIVFFIGTCNRFQQNYSFTECSEINISNYDYSITEKKTIYDSLFTGHVIIDFRNIDSVSYDKIACIIVDICQKESLIKAYFYENENCLYVNEYTFDSLDVYEVQEFYDCYIGQIDLSPDDNWKNKLHPSDIEFLIKFGNFKF